MQIVAGRQQSSNVGSKRSKAVQIDIDRPHPLDLIERDLIAGAVKCLSEDFLIPLNQLDSMEPIFGRGSRSGASARPGHRPR